MSLVHFESVVVDARRVDGKVFQIVGPETAKLRRRLPLLSAMPAVSFPALKSGESKAEEMINEGIGESEIEEPEPE